MTLRTIGAAGCVALALAACGGGGDSASTTNQASVTSASNTSTKHTVSGTVATGKPVANARVQIWGLGPNTGSNAVQTKTDANGHYNVTLDGTLPPYWVSVENQEDNRYPAMSAFSASDGIINVTPLTDLQAAILAGDDQIYSGLDASAKVLALSNLTVSQLDAARQKVLDLLARHPSKDDQSVMAPISVPGTGDFVTNSFNPVAGDTYDDSLEAFSKALLDSETLFGLQEVLLNKDVAAADLTKAVAPFAVRCEGNLCRDPLNLSAPALFKKMSLLKALRNQLYRTNSFNKAFECSTDLSIANSRIGHGSVSLDGDVIQLTVVYSDASTSKVRFHMPSTYYAYLDVVSNAQNPSQPLISRYFGHNVATLSKTSGGSFAMEFDSIGMLSKARVEQTKDGIYSNLECRPAF